MKALKVEQEKHFFLTVYVDYSTGRLVAIATDATKTLNHFHTKNRIFSLLGFRFDVYIAIVMN